MTSRKTRSLHQKRRQIERQGACHVLLGGTTKTLANGVGKSNDFPAEITFNISARANMSGNENIERYTFPNSAISAVALFLTELRSASTKPASKILSLSMEACFDGAALRKLGRLLFSLTGYPTR